MFYYEFPKKLILLTITCINDTQYQVRVDTLSEEFYRKAHNWANTG